MKAKIKYTFIGVVVSVIIFFLFGVITALIPNLWFTRMVRGVALDYFFLIASSALLGIYIGIHFYKKNISKKCNLVAGSSGFGTFLAFSCPICNKILILLFGTTALLAYFEPYRHYLGFLSIGLLIGALYFRVNN